MLPKCRSRTPAFRWPALRDRCENVSRLADVTRLTVCARLLSSAGSQIPARRRTKKKEGSRAAASQSNDMHRGEIFEVDRSVVVPGSVTHSAQQGSYHGTNA